METLVKASIIVWAAWLICFSIATFLWCRKAVLAGEWDTASEKRLNDWMARNPGVYIGLSPDGIALVVDRISSYKNWIKVFKLSSPVHAEFIEYLESLLNEFPDPAPEEAPSTTASQRGCFYIVPERGLEPPHLSIHDFESCASTIPPLRQVK